MIKYLNKAAFLLCVVGMAACSNVQTEPASEQQPQQGQWVAVGEAENGYQKAGAPIRLESQFVQVAGITQVEVPLRVTALSAVDRLLLNYSGSDGLQIAGAGSESLAGLPAGETLLLAVPVISNSQGGGTLNVFATTVKTVDGRVIESLRSFAVTVGENAAPKSKPPLDYGEDGKAYQTINL